MVIAVTGATGQLGQLVIKSLKQKVAASEIVALVRSRSAVVGVAARVADYSKPETLDAALKGVDTLLLISSNDIGQRTEQHLNVIAAAGRQGVGRIVYTSLLRADTSPLSLAPEHVATEIALKASCIPFTILRNGWYTENYTGSIPAALDAGAYFGSSGDGHISSASRQDFADAAAVVLTTEGHEGHVYELAGDSAYTLSDLAAEISRQTGRDIPYRNLPEADFAAALLSAGLPEVFARGIASWGIGASNGALFDDGKQLSKLIGRPTTAFGASVAASLIEQAKVA